MHEVRDEIEVTLWTSSSTLSTKRLLIRKAKQKQSEIVHHDVIGMVIQARTFVHKVDVPSHGSREVRLRDFRTPDGKKAIAFGVCILEGGTLPLITTSSQSGATKQRVIKCRVENEWS